MSLCGEGTNELHNIQLAFPNNYILNFTYLHNINNKLPFLDRHKKQFCHLSIPTNSNSFTFNYKSECPEQHKTAMTKNLIYRAQLISSSKTIFYAELKNIKQTLINNDFPNHIVNEQIKRAMKNIKSNCNGNNTTSNNSKYIKLFFITRCTNTTNSIK